MCSLWRENYSKDTPSLSYKIAYFHFLTTLLPSISLPFLSSINKKDGGFCIAFAKKEYICRKKTKLTQQRDFAF